MCVYVFEMISIRAELIDMTLRSRRLMGHLIGQMGKKVRDEKVNVSMLQPMCLNKYMMIFFLSSLWHTKNAFKAKPISD